MHAMSLESIAAILREAEEIVVFSGAGLSADSGIPTFRDGATGLWNNVDPDEVASIAGFLRNPQRAWNWLLQLKTLVDERRPNAGHQAIARLEADLPLALLPARRPLQPAPRAGHRWGCTGCR